MISYLYVSQQASLVENSNGPPVPWEGDNKVPPQRLRSQSVSDEQWAQMMATQGQFPPQGHPNVAEIAAIAAARRGFNTIGSSSRTSAASRGMVSSASVCDLNTLGNQQQGHAFAGHGVSIITHLHFEDF